MYILIYTRNAMLGTHLIYTTLRAYPNISTFEVKWCFVNHYYISTRPTFNVMSWIS